jgi:hypothetical protein
MSLLTMKLEDIHPIDCGIYTVRYGFTKGLPRYKPFVLLHDSFLLGKHEVCLTNKELFGGVWGSGKMWNKGREKFLTEVLGPVLNPWKREEALKQVADMEDGDESKIVVSLVRENFDEVRFSNIIELKLRRHSFWAYLRTIDITYQSGSSISFAVCIFNPLLGIERDINVTKKVFTSIQNGVNTYRR